MVTSNNHKSNNEDARVNSNEPISWEHYSRIYWDYVLTTFQTNILVLLAREVFADFPKNLPPSLKKALRDLSTSTGKAFAEWSSSQSKDEGRHSLSFQLTDSLGGKFCDKKGREFNFQLDDFGNRIFLDWFGYLVAHVIQGYKQVGVDFERLLSQQQVAMIFAQLDGFFADTLRLICVVRPDVMKSDKKVSAERILECVTWEQLMTYLCEQYLFEFGLKSLTKRMDFLRNRLGLEISYSDDEIKLLEVAEKTRHIVIHNNGRVTADYIRETQRTDVMPGDLIPLPFTYLDDVTKAARKLVKETFCATSVKFFNVPTTELVDRLIF